MAQLPQQPQNLNQPANNNGRIRITFNDDRTTWSSNVLKFKWEDHTLFPRIGVMANHKMLISSQAWGVTLAEQFNFLFDTEIEFQNDDVVCAFVLTLLANERNVVWARNLLQINNPQLIINRMRAYFHVLRMYLCAAYAELQASDAFANVNASSTLIMNATVPTAIDGPLKMSGLQPLVRVHEYESKDPEFVSLDVHIPTQTASLSWDYYRRYWLQHPHEPWCGQWSSDYLVFKQKVAIGAINWMQRDHYTRDYEAAVAFKAQSGPNYNPFAPHQFVSAPFNNNINNNNQAAPAQNPHNLGLHAPRQDLTQYRQLQEQKWLIQEKLKHRYQITAAFSGEESDSRIQFFKWFSVVAEWSKVNTAQPNFSHTHGIIALEKTLSDTALNRFQNSPLRSTWQTVNDVLCWAIQQFTSFSVAKDLSDELQKYEIPNSFPANQIIPWFSRSLGFINLIIEIAAEKLGRDLLDAAQWDDKRQNQWLRKKLSQWRDGVIPSTMYHYNVVNQAQPLESNVEGYRQTINIYAASDKCVNYETAHSDPIVVAQAANHIAFVLKTKSLNNVQIAPFDPDAYVPSSQAPSNDTPQKSSLNNINGGYNRTRPNGNSRSTRRRTRNNPNRRNNSSSNRLQGRNLSYFNGFAPPGFRLSQIDPNKINCNICIANRNKGNLKFGKNYMHYTEDHDWLKNSYPGILDGTLSNNQYFDRVKGPRTPAVRKYCHTNGFHFDHWLQYLADARQWVQRVPVDQQEEPIKYRNNRPPPNFTGTKAGTDPSIDNVSGTNNNSTNVQSGSTRSYRRTYALQASSNQQKALPAPSVCNSSQSYPAPSNMHRN